ncbi:unnamed protein product [Trichobilharzia regenti]|nr:unnamed protein product [Trichobilharzia regenti]
MVCRRLSQSYEEFLAKATFSIEEYTCNYVNESNDHESEFDSALLENHEDMEKSNKLPGRLIRMMIS